MGGHVSDEAIGRDIVEGSEMKRTRKGLCAFGAGGAGPRRCDDQDWEVSKSRPHKFEYVHRRAVHPVQVVGNGDDSSVRARLFEEAEDGEAEQKTIRSWPFLPAERDVERRALTRRECSSKPKKRVQHFVQGTESDFGSASHSFCPEEESVLILRGCDDGV
ncbi:hypothetical protein BJK06_04785 [Curtobacterium sp. BH-2-1-1]|nr:hypothetical protein BJK06_04785 [Curtobacterium sp. BH-2-1-1]